MIRPTTVGISSQQTQPMSQTGSENEYIILGTTKYDSQSNIPLQMGSYNNPNTEINKQFPKRPTTTNSKGFNLSGNRIGMTQLGRTNPNRTSMNLSKPAIGSMKSFTKYVNSQAMNSNEARS